MTVLYAGLDVSLELTNVCIVDDDGRLVHESRVGSDCAATIKVRLSVNQDETRRRGCDEGRA